MTETPKIDLIVGMIESLNELSDNDAARLVQAAVGRTAMTYKIWHRRDIEGLLEDSYPSMSRASAARVIASVESSYIWRNDLSDATENDWYLIELAIEDALRELQIRVER